MNETRILGASARVGQEQRAIGVGIDVVQRPGTTGAARGGNPQRTLVQLGGERPARCGARLAEATARRAFREAEQKDAPLALGAVGQLRQRRPIAQCGMVERERIVGRVSRRNGDGERPRRCVERSGDAYDLVAR